VLVGVSIHAGRRRLAHLFEHAEDLADATDQQTLLVDLDPRTGRGGEDDVVAGGDRHPDADVLPPVQALADGEHDPVLRWRLVRAGGHEQAGASEALRLELLDHDAVKQRAQELLHPGQRRRPASGKMQRVRSTRAGAGSIAFFLAGPGLEAGLGPWLLVRVAGSEVDDWPAVLRVVGALLMVVGIATLVDVFARFVRDGAGTPSPAAPTTHLLIGGAFRHLRHPMYVATATVIVGEALLFAQPILFVGAAAYLTAMATLAHTIEDPRLARRFGASYDTYRQAVPGWIPRTRPWDNH
jgi:protein-S-isoprenylcysteine O-methyltransferase Ste14